MIASSSEPSATTREGFGRAAAVGRDEDGREEEAEEDLIREVGAGSFGLRVILSKPMSVDRGEEVSQRRGIEEEKRAHRSNCPNLNHLRRSHFVPNHSPPRSLRHHYHPRCLDSGWVSSKG